MPHLFKQAVAIKRIVHEPLPLSVGQSVDDLSCGGGVRLRLLQRAELTADLDEGGDGLVEVVAFVRGGELYADTCLALGDDGVVEARDVDPFFEEACSVFLRELSIVEHHGADS